MANANIVAELNSQEYLSHKVSNKTNVNEAVVLLMFLDDCFQVCVTVLKDNVLSFLALLVFRIEDVKHLHTVLTALEPLQDFVLTGNILPSFGCTFDRHNLVVLLISCLENVTEAA